MIVDDFKNPNGILTLGEKNREAEIGLIAVDKSLKEKGIGRNLIQRVFYEAIKMNYTRINVSTQMKNVTVCYFYLKMGFSLSKNENIYHFWNKL